MKKNIRYCIFMWAMFASSVYATKHDEKENYTAYFRTTLPKSLDVIRAKLADIHNSSAGSCSGIDSIESILEVIESKVEGISQCGVTSITQDGPAPTPILLTETERILINSPGHYCLARDVDTPTGVPSAITISSSNVTLDLGNKTLTGPLGAGVSGMIVNSVQNIIIKNGTIVGFDTAIETSTPQALTIINCTFIGQAFYSVVAVGGNKLIIDGCASYNAPIGGFRLIGCTNSSITNSIVSDVFGTDSVYGFWLNGGSSNIIENCSVEGVTTTQTNSTSVATGILLDVGASTSSVINCTVGSVTTPSDPTFATPSFSIPTGISLQVLNGNLTASGTIATGANVESVAWSPDGQYLAVGTLTNGSTELRVYVLTDLGTLLLLPGANIEIGADVVGLAWSPDGQYLAICFGNSVTVYSFVAQTLTSVATVADVGDAVRAISWSADGYYLAFGLITGTVNELQVWSFTGTALTSITSVAYGANVNSVDWSPNNHWIALGDENAVAAIYNFDGVTLTSLDTQSTGGGFLNQVAWSPHGDFLAIVQTGSSSPIVYPVTNTGTFGTGINGASASSSSVAWSPDGRFLAYYDSDTTLRTAQLRRTGGVFSLLPIASIAVTTVQSSLSWSNDGHMVATGGVLNAGVGVRTYTATFTAGGTNCVVKDCTVSNVSGSQGTGVGLYASSDDNFAIGNVAFENDINYVGISNTYNDGYFGTPTLIQNIGIPPL